MTDYVDDGDIDLHVEEVLLRDGTRLTEARAAQIAEETLSEVRLGRPTLAPGTRRTALVAQSWSGA